MKELLLLGGGYGNIRILHEILDDLPKNMHITLVDRLPYHCLKTEYYAIAAGTISDTEVRMSFPDHPQVTIKYGEIESLDLEDQQVYLKNDQPLHYDELIIGLGCEDNYHHISGADEHTLSIQSIHKARKTYQKLNNLHPNGVISIVGGGLSGVELASELCESRPDLTIRLFDRGDIILSGYSKRLSRYVQNWLLKHGVEVVNHSTITKVEENLIYNHDVPVESDAIVWTAGIRSNWIVRELDLEKDKQGRLVLTAHHNLEAHPNVFVVGDCASLPYAPSAQLAEAQGDQIVEVFKRKWNNKRLPELPEIKLKGVFGSLGKKAGFGKIGNTTITGRVPRLLKSGILWMYKHHSG